MTEKRTVQKEDLFRLKFLQSARLSPDGQRIVYAVSHVDVDKEEEFSALWMMSLDSGEARQFTSGTSQDGNPRWSPDGKRIAFISARSGKPQIYVISSGGGEARQLTDTKQGVGGGPEWSPDGKHIAFTAGPAKEPRDPGKPYRVDRKVFRFDGMENLDDVVQDIYVISVKGGEPTRLTEDRYHNAAPQWSPDGSEILYMVSMPPEGNRWLPGVRVVNLSGEVRDLVWEWGSAQAAAWLPDGKRIVFIGQPHGKLPGSKNDLWLIDRQGGEPECRSVGLKVGVGGSLQPDMPVWGLLEARILPTKDGKYAFVGVQDGGTLHVYKAALGGKELLKPVVAGECACLLLDGNADHLLYAVSTLHDPTNLYISRANGSQERQLTCLNDEWLSRIKQPEVERLLFPSSDGVEVEGWIMKPPTGKPPYPTILYIHGGPYGAWGNIFSFDFQMLAGAGYAVLFLNYRGSSGYSDEFATAIQADWGNLDYQDHMAGVDYVIAKGIADADRLGVCGLSAGGYGTCSIIGKTNRFKAAMPENPVTNLVSLYGVSDIGQFVIEMMGGKPHERAEVFAVCSPLSYAHDCTTPTLLVQGEADRRCPADQSEQFYAVLKDNGCIVEMLRLPGCSHIGTIAGPPVARRVANEAMLAWMDRYVLGAGS